MSAKLPKCAGVIISKVTRAETENIVKSKTYSSYMHTCTSTSVHTFSILS